MSFEDEKVDFDTLQKTSVDEDSDDEQILLVALILAGFSAPQIAKIVSDLKEIPEIDKAIKKTRNLSNPEKRRISGTQEVPPIDEIKPLGDDGLTNALIQSDIPPDIALAASAILTNEEAVIQILISGGEPVEFMTQMDSRVDDVICLPLQGEVFDRDDPNRIRIDEDTHTNCRCYYRDPISGKNLGQF
jgi:hypothetical protein